MQNKSNRIPDEKVPDMWLTNCPVDLGELSLRANWDLIIHRDVQSYYSVLEKSIIDIEKGITLLSDHFARFGLEMHIGTGKKTSNTECVFFLPPGFSNT